MAAGKAQGLYFGLPTMATANAMFERMANTWLALYLPDSRPSLILAHSARRLMDRFNQSIWSVTLSGTEEPDEGSLIVRDAPPGLPTAIKKRCWRRLA